VTKSRVRRQRTSLSVYRMHARAKFCAAVAGGAIALGACSIRSNLDAPDAGSDDAERRVGHPPNKWRDAAVEVIDAPISTTPDASIVTPSPLPSESIAVTLVADGVTGAQRVNFAVPLSLGKLSDASKLRVLAGAVEVPAARRVLARYSDGSARSVQLQLDVNVSTTTNLTVQLGVTGASGPTMADVTTTLAGSGNNIHPKVWAQLPATYLAASGVAGPVTPRSSITGTALDAWNTLCNYDTWNTDAFLVNAASSRDVWLFDRVTAMYRGYAATGSISPLRSAYREAAIYLGGMTITNGVTTAIAPPNANTDLKYYYSQGVALHYLLTGDDRYREAAEAVSAKVVTMWNPTYNNADGFWTERHAGFALLAHEWATIVSDDKAATIAARAETAVTAFLNHQNSYPSNYTDTTARCWAHTANAHGETFGYVGCSPWMSAILADALDAHARRVGGTRATQIQQSLAKLGRIIARDGLDSTGKPYYWMGVGTTSDLVDDYDEHWGEAAYLVGMAWDASGRTETSLKTKADALLSGFRTNGVIGQVRSFNWQCRSAPMAPTFLK